MLTHREPACGEIISGSARIFRVFPQCRHSGGPNRFVEYSKPEIPEPPNKQRPNAMDATSNFSLRFAQASESKARMADRLVARQTLERIATGLSLISQAFGFSTFGTLMIANRHQADLNDFAGGGFVAMVGGISAILVGTAFLIATCLYWRFCARRSAALAVRRKTACLTFPKPDSVTAIASLA